MLFEFIFMEFRSQFSLQRKRRPWDFSRWGDHPVSPYFLIGHTKPYLGRWCCQSWTWTTKKVCTDFFNGPTKLPNLASVSLIGAVTTRRLSSTTTISTPFNTKTSAFSWPAPLMTFFTLPTSRYLINVHVRLLSLKCPLWPLMTSDGLQRPQRQTLASIGLNWIKNECFCPYTFICYFDLLILLLIRPKSYAKPLITPI